MHAHTIIHSVAGGVPVGFNHCPSRKRRKMLLAKYYYYYYVITVYIIMLYKIMYIIMLAFVF